MASSWDPAVQEAAQHAAAQDSRAAGIQWTFTPMVDIARDARWGRIVEGAGEDPYLGSAMAAAQVRGFQGEYIGAKEAATTTGPTSPSPCSAMFISFLSMPQKRPERGAS